MNKEEAIRLLRDVGNDPLQPFGYRINAARYLFQLQLVEDAVTILKSIAGDDELTANQRLSAAHALWEGGAPDESAACYAIIQGSGIIDQETRRIAERSIGLIEEGKEPEEAPRDEAPSPMPAPVAPPPQPL